MKKEWNIIVAVVIVLLIVVTSLMYVGVIPSPDASVGVEGSRMTQDPSSTDDVRLDNTVLTEAACRTAGGTWNPCGSACRTDPDAICIELCVEYCECESYLECPEGYRCADRVEDIGVCVSL